MVTVKITQGLKPKYGFVVYAEGFGHNLLKKVESKSDAERWEKIAASRLIMQRLKGILFQRQIAYAAKHFVDPIKKDHIIHLGYYLDQLQGAAPEKVFKMIVVHQNRWRDLMPSKLNKMNDDMEEIIAYATNQNTNEN